MTITENPIDNDERLRTLLAEVVNITSRKAYQTWRRAFLKIYKKTLDANGILNGKDANYRLLKQLETLDRKIRLVQEPLSKNELRGDSNSRRLLTNLTEEVTATEHKIQEFLPKTNADEEKFGFDKFELAAVLLEDGFCGYDTMKASRDTLNGILHAVVKIESENNDGEPIVDGNFEQILQIFYDSVESFVSVMDDLKLCPIMNRCVDVVFKGKERPEPKPPPPPAAGGSGGGAGGDDATVDTLDDDATVDTLDDDDDDDKDGDDGTGKPKKKKKKPKKKKEKSSRNLLGKPSSSKKKPSSSKNLKTPKSKKKLGASNHSKDSVDTVEEDDNEELPEDNGGDANDDTGALSSKPKSSKKQKKKPKSNPNKGNEGIETDDDDEENQDDEEEEDEEEDEDEDEDDGEPPQSEFLLYFDPKTNTIGRIDRLQAIQSPLVADQSGDDENGGDYKDIIQDQEEKQEIIFLLKKLERQKPQEESWLDKIKKEKEETAATAGTTQHQNKSTARTSISKRNNMSLKPHNSSKMKANASKQSIKSHVKKKGLGEKQPSQKGSVGPGSNEVDVEKMAFRNPLAEASSTKSGSGIGKKKQKGAPLKRDNYRAAYKQTADKPDTDGWKNMSSSSRCLQ